MFGVEAKVRQAMCTRLVRVSKVPFTIDRHGESKEPLDVYSRLLRDRIIFLGTEIDSTVANLFIAQLLFLEKEDPEKDIAIYINSPGGSVLNERAMYDTMQYVKPDVRTVCVGQAASAAATILAGGANGKRACLENAEVMIHQPLYGIKGQATHIEIHTEWLLRLRESGYEILAKHTGKSTKQIAADSERDCFMTAQEALEYGLVDSIIPAATSSSRSH